MLAKAAKTRAAQIPPKSVPVSAKVSCFECSAVLANVPEQLIRDPIDAIMMHNVWITIAGAWPFVLIRGTYTVYCCIDYGTIAADGNFLPIGISTSKYQLQKYRDDALGKDFRILELKRINGLAALPQMGPARSPHPTIRQG